MFLFFYLSVLGEYVECTVAVRTGCTVISFLVWLKQRSPNYSAFFLLVPVVLSSDTKCTKSAFVNPILAPRIPKVLNENSNHLALPSL
jgi:hypothetical protein